MKTEILNMFISTTCLWLVVGFWGLTARCDFDEIQRRDPVGAVLMAYVEAVDEFRDLKDPSPTARLAHYQEWKERFQKIVAEYPLKGTQFPRDLFIRTAKGKLLSLYNGLEEYDKSQALLQEMISEARSPEEKIDLYNELGTVSRTRHWSSQNQSDIQKAQEAFEQANTLFLSLSPEERERDSSIGGAQIVNLCTAAMATREANDHAKSATLFRSARELFQSSTESAKYAVTMGYDLEIIAEQEMLQWIRVKEEVNALHCLKILSELPSYRWVPSYYALGYSTLWYTGDSKGFQDFVSKWLDENAFDDRTPILMARLGFSYFDDKLFEKALPIYEALRDKHRADFQKLESKAFQQGSGGYYEKILHHLNQIYSQQNDRGKAERTKTEMISLFPESPLVTVLYDPKSAEDQTEFTLPERGRYLAFRIFCLITGIVLILWIFSLRTLRLCGKISFYRKGRKERKEPQI